MGRYRSRSRSYSPRPPPRRNSRSPPPRPKRYDEPRGGGFRDRHATGRSGLLVRNISLDARPDDLRVPFERFGPVKDVYLPKNYYTGEPRGFGFVKFRNAEDAAEAKLQMNHQVIGGREITIVFAEENRKTPREMRSTGRVSGRSSGGSYRRLSPRRSPRRRYESYSRSPSPVRHDSRGRSGRDEYFSPPRSMSPPARVSRGHRSHQPSLSPRKDVHSPYSRSPSRSRSYSPR